MTDEAFITERTLMSLEEWLLLESAFCECDALCVCQWDSPVEEEA